MASGAGAAGAFLRPTPTNRLLVPLFTTKLPLPETLSAVFAPALASLKTMPTPIVKGPLTVRVLPAPIVIWLGVAELGCTVRLVAVRLAAVRSSVLVLVLA